MARLLGIRADDVTPFARWLLPAPVSLADLANAEPRGWGVAVYDSRTEEWAIERRGFGATHAETFASISPRLRGTVLIAHLRSRADHASSSATTQPIRRGEWVFASDGTVDDIDFVRRSISPSRLRECSDGTHADLLFAFLLTQIDGAGPGDTDSAVRTAIGALMEHRAATMTFLLSNGRALYGHKGKPALHVVEEVGGARVGVIASEALSDGPWRALDDASLVRVGPELAFLLGEDPRARWDERDIELPFTD